MLRETVTSYTAACFIDTEQRCSLRSALIRLCVDLRPLDGPLAVIRTDPAPGFVALSKDDLLRLHRMCIEVGRVKNPNKNPVAEKAVQELEDEILRQDPARGSVSDLTLCLAVALLNSRIRSNGLSARELWCQRDQFTNSQLPISDLEVITSQHERRKINHPYNEKAKTPSCRRPGVVLVDVGDLVYLHIDRNKSRARDRYLVVSVDDNWCYIRKFCGNQLRSTSYKVKRSECYKVSSLCELPVRHRRGSDTSDEEGDSNPKICPTPPPIPAIPDVLSLPATEDVNSSRPDADNIGRP